MIVLARKYTLFPYTTLFLSKRGPRRALSTPPRRRGARVMRVTLADIERSEEHTSELQSHHELVCRILLEKKNKQWRRPAPMSRRRLPCGRSPIPYRSWWHRAC